jgi:hypothetical protein
MLSLSWEQHKKKFNQVTSYNIFLELRRIMEDLSHPVEIGNDESHLRSTQLIA